MDSPKVSWGWVCCSYNKHFAADIAGKFPKIPFVVPTSGVVNPVFALPPTYPKRVNKNIGRVYV